MKATARVYILLLLPVLAGLVGCSTRYQVRVDALSTLPARSTTVQTYTLVNKTPGDEADSLFFSEVARHLKPALRKAGFVEGKANNSDLIIRVKAYLSDPLIETRTAFSPVYMDYPARSAVVRVPVVNSDGKVVRYTYTHYYTYPRRDLAGYMDRDLQVTVYDKLLEISARERNPDGTAGEEVWSTKVALRSQSTDYRMALPAMVVAAEPYFGRRTDGEIVLTLHEDSSELEAYRRALSDGR